MMTLPTFLRSLMQRRFVLIAASLALVVIIILGSSAAILSNLRESALSNVENALARRSLMLAAQADLSLQTLSQVMASVAEYVAHENFANETDFNARLAGEDVHRMLKERIIGDVQIAAVGFFDTDGKLVNTSRIWPAPNISISDWGQYEDLRAGIQTGRYVSKPFRNRASGSFDIAIAQPVKNRDGVTLGYLTGLLNLSYFEQYWQAALDRDELDSSISLNRLDGTILVRYPNNDLVGMRFENGIQNRLKETSSVVARRKSQIDGKPRIESAHVLQSYPLFIRVSETEETALGNWVRTAQMTGVIVACLILLVLMVAYGLWRRSEENARRARMEAEKLQFEKARLIAEAEVHRSRDAEVQARRLNAAVENMTQGLIMFDADERLVVINEHFINMYALSRDIVKPGCAFRDVIAYRHALGQLKNPPEHYYKVMAALQKNGATAHHTSEMPDGRVISVFNRAIPNGGWVGTHEDITDLQRQEEALRDALNESQETRLQLDAALNNMTQGLIMYDAQERVVVVNVRYLKMYDLSSDIVKPGITLREIIAYRVRIGQIVGDPDAFCDIVRKKRNVGNLMHMQELVDGRIISIVNRPMAGGGWVVTHEDVTLLKKNEAALQEALGESRETQIRLDAALNNMTHGLIMCDAQSNVVVFNSEYLKMYGLPQDTRPGVTLEELFVLRAAAGTLPASFQHSGTKENYIAHVLDKVGSDRSFDATTTLPDGRQISIVNRPMAQGGWVATHQDVTVLLRNEQKTRVALEESRAARIQLDAAINNMSQGLVMCDEQHKIVVVNDKYIQMYGLSPDVVKPGCTFADLISHRAANGHLADNPEAYRESVLARVAREKSFDMTATTKDGREVLIYNRPVAGGGWLATHQDISDQKQAARQLEETRRFLDTVVENAPVAIVVKDAHTRRVVLVNRAYEELVGKDRSELVGKSAYEIYSPIKAPIVARRDEEKLMSDHIRVRGETWIDKPDGSTRSVATTSFVVRDNEGAPHYLIVAIEDITERKKSEARIAHMAHHDGLTNLPNRVLLHERLKEKLGRIQAADSIAVLYLDLDHFKRVNDTLGHIVGNELLKVVADRLRGCIGENDIVARLSGDEFLIVRGNIESSDEAAAFAQAVRETVALPIILEGNQIFTDISIGIAVAPEHGSDVPQLMKCADMALYAAKSDGRGTFRFFEPAMSARMNERRALELDLRKAIEAGELELNYQPLVKLQTNEIVGFEALMRWHHPERGLIPPAEFIPIAEETGLIGTIGHWALRTACFEAATWPDNTKVAVNVSPVQFKNSNLAFSVASILAASGLSPRRLEIEITEAVLMDDNETTLETLHRMHDLGVRIAMDDFGTGYSSLSYLRSFPFDKIKIDRSFIKDLCENEDSVAIVRSIASLATSLDIMTTAEGVETQAQLEWVRALGCTEAQGFHFGHPKRGADLGDYFKPGAVKPKGSRSAA